MEKKNRRAVVCFVEARGRILLLHRLPDRPHGDKWGAVVGKVEDGEEDMDAMLREIKEETGLEVLKRDLEFLKEFRGMPVYRVSLEREFIVRVRESEHQGFMWVSPRGCFMMNDTVPGMREFLLEFGYVERSDG